MSLGLGEGWKGGVPTPAGKKGGHSDVKSSLAPHLPFYRLPFKQDVSLIRGLHSNSN